MAQRVEQLNGWYVGLEDTGERWWSWPARFGPQGLRDAFQAGAAWVWWSGQWHRPQTGGQIARGGDVTAHDHYPPYAERTVALFRRAAQVAGLPTEWARERGLHVVLDGESSGWVGRPNYTYQRVFGDDAHKPSRRDVWPRVWAQLRQGQITARSSATGLGQLLLSNVEEYYPSGATGIGDAIEEAVGMLRYIEDRYGNPQTAGEYYELPQCEDIYPEGEEPQSWYSPRALRRNGGPGCKPGGGY